MCFYYGIQNKNSKALVEHKLVHADQLLKIKERPIVSGFERPNMPVLGISGNGAIDSVKWGFVPSGVRSYAEADKFVSSYNTLNAVGENVFGSRLYSEAIMQRRCLVMCSGFYEWYHLKSGSQTEKYPFYITLSDESMFVMAGIWNQFTDGKTGNTVQTFSILTTQANPLMEKIHNSKKRMPLILEASEAHHWIDSKAARSEIADMIAPFPAEKMVGCSIEKFSPAQITPQKPVSIQAFAYPQLWDVSDEHGRAVL